MDDKRRWFKTVYQYRDLKRVLTEWLYSKYLTFNVTALTARPGHCTAYHIYQSSSTVLQYESLPKVPKDVDVLKWWYSQSAELPIMFKIARHVLGVPVSSSGSGHSLRLVALTHLREVDSPQNILSSSQ